MVGVTRELQVAEVHTFSGNESVMDAVAAILDIARRRPVIELCFDPWRFQSEALRLKREHRLTVVEIPMSTSRLSALSEGLHGSIIEKRLTHPDHPVLNRHVADAVAIPTPRGWRLSKQPDDSPIDALVALAMGVSRAAEAPKAEPKLLGWL